MVARGRRVGLSSGYVIGVAGALLAGTAVVTRSFPLLLLGSVLIGFGNALEPAVALRGGGPVPRPLAAPRPSGSSSGARRSAPSSGRTSSAGPAQLGESIGLPPLAGAYLAADRLRRERRGPVVRHAPARPVRARRPVRPSRTDDRSTARRRSGASCARPNVPVAMVALVTVQVVMVLIMTMTPLHMTDARARPGRGRHRHQRPHVRDVRAVAGLRPADRPIREHPRRDRRAR